MTKSLTKKWKDGKLEEGLYYIEAGNQHDICVIRNRYCPVLTSPYCEDNVFEPEFVPVEPVPNFDHFSQLVKKVKKLKKQLKEANVLLSCFLDESPCRFDHNGCCQEHNSCEYGGKCVQKDLKNYLEKWCVK